MKDASENPYNWKRCFLWWPRKTAHGWIWGLMETRIGVAGLREYRKVQI